MGDRTWPVAYQGRRLLIAYRPMRGNAPPHVPANLDPVEYKPRPWCMCIRCRLGTTHTEAGASQRPTPSLVRAFPPSLLLVHPCEAQRCEGLRRHQSADRPPEMKRSTHITARLVVLAVCLHPVQTQRVQERRQTLKRADQIPRRPPPHIMSHDAGNRDLPP